MSKRNTQYSQQHGKLTCVKHGQYNNTSHLYGFNKKNLYMKVRFISRLMHWAALVLPSVHNKQDKLCGQTYTLKNYATLTEQRPPRLFFTAAILT